MRKPDHLKAFREVPKAGVFWDSFSEMQEAVATHTMALGKAMVRKYRLAEYAISVDDNTALEVAFGFDLYRHGLIQNPNIPFHEGEYKNYSHPLVTFDYTTFPPNSTIEENEDGVPGQLTCVGRFLHGKGGLIFRAELPDSLDHWPLTSASDFHKLRIRKECHP
ncbi:hypothetical protein H0H93_011819 [Arthromyces matolae]|nr:hypothetical protein H0H93_011819 [Arthromyces matolae]